jgi:hypothetical protein
MVLCVALLPLVSLAVLLALPDRVSTVLLDPIAVFVYAAVGVSLISGEISFEARRTVWPALAYAVVTGVLSIVPVAVLLVSVLTINYGDGDMSGAC